MLPAGATRVAGWISLPHWVTGPFHGALNKLLSLLGHTSLEIRPPARDQTILEETELPYLVQSRYNFTVPRPPIVGRKVYMEEQLFHGAVAQLGERRVRNAKVEGSIPFRSTTIQKTNRSRLVFFARPVSVGAGSGLCCDGRRRPGQPRFERFFVLSSRPFSVSAKDTAVSAPALARVFGCLFGKKTAFTQAISPRL